MSYQIIDRLLEEILGAREMEIGSKRLISFREDSVDFHILAAMCTSRAAR